MNEWIVPDWPAPKNVKALFTTRNGGVSGGRDNAYATLNLGGHVKDDLSDVEKNRSLLNKYLPSAPKWLEQVHGTTLLCMDKETASLQGDAALSRTHGIVCAVMVADFPSLDKASPSLTNTSLLPTNTEGRGRVGES